MSSFFQTRFDDSALFHASGEDQKFHHISVSIHNGTVVVEVDLGDNGPIDVNLGENVNCNKWFNLTILHNSNVINVSLNEIQKTIYIKGTMNYIYIDPEIYIGGGPELHKKKGNPHNSFLRNVSYIMPFRCSGVLYFCTTCYHYVQTYFLSTYLMKSDLFITKISCSRFNYAALTVFQSATQGIWKTLNRKRNEKLDCFLQIFFGPFQRLNWCCRIKANRPLNCSEILSLRTENVILLVIVYFNFQLNFCTLSTFTGLKSNNFFVGSLKYVFFNDISILYELKRGNPKVHYIGLLEPEYADSNVDSIPITFPFHSSHIRWYHNHPSQLFLKFDFKSYKNLAVLAAAEVTTENGVGYWEVIFFFILF